jgi:alanyl-tRNA synthetase
LTERLFRDDPYLLEFDAVVLARREHSGRPAVVLDRTAFYAESGGQPSDAGTLGGVPVVAVIDEGPDVLHVLERALEGTRVHGRVDERRRRDHLQQHHGQHLLSRAFVEVANARTVSFHLGTAVSTIDLDREVGEPEIRAAESRANAVVWEARPVSVRTLSAAEARALGIEPPPDAGDAVRIVEAGGFDRQPCGGTHPRSTAEVGVVIVLGRERYKAGTRVRFVCGHRALDACRERNTVLDGLSRILSAPIEALPEAASRTVDRLADSDKRVRDLTERALEEEARRLLAEAPAHSAGLPTGTPPVVVAAYDGWPLADLRALALHLVRLSRCVALLGSRSDKAHLVFAQSEGLGHDIPALLSSALEHVEGRGGGKGNLAQGAGERPDRLDDALRRSAAGLRSQNG